MARIALAGGFYKARSIIASAQRCLNLYPEKNPPDSPFPYTHYPTPGLTVLGFDPNNQTVFRGLYRATTGDLYGVVGAVVYYIDSSWSFHALGMIAAGSSPVSMVDNGLVLLLVDGAPDGYAIDLSTGSRTFAAVTDPAFYGADAVFCLDTYFILNRPSTTQFYISLSEITFQNLTQGLINPDSLYAAFDPLDIAAKTTFPDKLVTLYVVRGEIWLIGEATTEVWYNSGAADFTFQIMPGVLIQHGCIAKYSLATEDSAIFWLSRDPQGQNIVLMGAQYQVKRVSTSAIEQEISQYSEVSDAIGFVYQQQGHVFYQLTFPTADKTWIYDVGEELWHERAWLDDNGALHRHRANCAANAYDTVVVGDWQDGNLYQYDLNNYTDNGSRIFRARSFPHLVGENGNRVSYSQFIADVSVGSSTNMVTAIEVEDGGSYTEAPAVTVSGGGGRYAAALAVVTTSFTEIDVTNGGFGYASAPTVQILGGGGSGASATAAIANAISSLVITEAGTGFTSPPSVSFSGGGGTGATASTEIANALTIAVTNPGSNYATPPSVILIGGGGTGAAAVANLANGKVISVTLTSPGTGYTSAPSLTFSGGGGTGAAATVLANNGGVTSIAVTAAGIYSSVPAVTFSGGGGTGAAGTALVSGQITSISVINGGNYGVPPRVSIVGGGGTGATATAVISTSEPSDEGPVVAVIITNPGSGYTSTPTVMFTTGVAGATATGTATRSYGVTGVNITNPGTGYASAPSVAFAGAGGAAATATVSTGLSGITVTNPGSSYTFAPSVTLTGGGGTGAAASAVISAVVGSVTLTNAGEDYTSAPSVTFSSATGSGAAATASLSGYVSAINLINPGTGYTSNPMVTLSGGGGTGATATATVTDRVVSVLLTNPGTGYVTSPAIIFSGGGGTGAAAVAKLSGPVSAIVVTNPGYGYTDIPDVILTGGNGAGAIATAIVRNVPPFMSLVYSDTRGATWGNPVLQELGSLGQFYTQPQWQRLGMARDRVFELSWSYPAPTALNGAYITTVSMRS